MKKSFMREKVIHCGKDYLSPEIFPYTGTQQQAVKGKRGKKKKVSEPKQKNLNDKRAKRYFIQLANANFGEGDLAVHLTYAPEFLPDSYEEAIKIVINFLRRVAYLRKKRGLPPLKYLLITQMGRNGKRIHHHILMNGGLDRDEVESLWWKVKESKKKKRPAVMYGWANADRLKPNKKGIANMAGYMVQDSTGKKHWTQSQNLEKPWYRPPNDKKYTRRQLAKIAKLPPDSEEYRAFWEKQYKGWELVEAEQQYVEQSGWYFYLTMRRTRTFGQDGGGRKRNFRTMP